MTRRLSSKFLWLESFLKDHSYFMQQCFHEFFLQFLIMQSQKDPVYYELSFWEILPLELHLRTLGSPITNQDKLKFSN